MANQYTEEVLKYLENIEFDEEIQDLIEVIKKNKHRIKFVKDSLGLTNSVILSTKDTLKELKDYDVPYCSMFLVMENNQLKEIHQFELDLIKDTVSHFLKTTTDFLYVEIVFPENLFKNDDYFKLLYFLEETKNSIPSSVLALRKFPEFYEQNAFFPYSLIEEDKLLKNMDTQESHFLNHLKKSLIAEMSDALNKDDKETFEHISEKIKRINKQIQTNSSI